MKISKRRPESTSFLKKKSAISNLLLNWLAENTTNKYYVAAKKKYAGMTLTEGGLGGHISHLHEDPQLTFGEIKNIFRTLASGKGVIEVQEKVDGQNIFFTYNIDLGQVRFARNKTHLKTGGMNRDDIVSKWGNLPKVQSAYLAAYDILQTILNHFSENDLIEIFGPNGTVWYSAEVITEINPNVINYDGNHIVLHEVAIEMGTEPDSVPKEANLSTTYNKLVELVSRVQDDIAKYNWKIHGKKIAKLLEVKDKKKLAQGFAAVGRVMAKYRLTDSSKIEDYLMARLKHALPEIESWPDEAVRILADVDSSTASKKKNIAAILSSQQGTPINLKDAKLFSQAEVVNKESLRSLENVFNMLTLQVLNDLQSLLVANPDAEVQRIRKAVASAIDSAESLPAESQEKLSRLVHALGGIEKIKSAIEGVLFRWNGKTYKITYPFSVVNKILGLFRY